MTDPRKQHNVSIVNTNILLCIIIFSTSGLSKLFHDNATLFTVRYLPGTPKCCRSRLTPPAGLGARIDAFSVLGSGWLESFVDHKSTRLGGSMSSSISRLTPPARLGAPLSRPSPSSNRDSLVRAVARCEESMTRIEGKVGFLSQALHTGCNKCLLRGLWPLPIGMFHLFLPLLAWDFKAGVSLSFRSFSLFSDLVETRDDSD